MKPFTSLYFVLRCLMLFFGKLCVDFSMTSVQCKLVFVFRSVKINLVQIMHSIMITSRTFQWFEFRNTYKLKLKLCVSANIIRNLNPRGICCSNIQLTFAIDKLIRLSNGCLQCIFVRYSKILYCFNVVAFFSIRLSLQIVKWNWILKHHCGRMKNEEIRHLHAKFFCHHRRRARKKDIQIIMKYLISMFAFVGLCIFICSHCESKKRTTHYTAENWVCATFNLNVSSVDQSR